MRRRALVLFALIVGLAACDATSKVSLHVDRTGAITWTPCGNVQCATLSVPLDRAHPTGAQITLALARRPASGKRVGVLFTNPGGPGASGVAFLKDATKVFGRDVLDHFDIVSWDPRGVGNSAPVRCLDDLDAFYAVDRSPHDAATVARNVDVTKQFVGACSARSGPELPFVSTEATARDMDAIRAAIGEDRISYMGFSYGTYLGTLYAELFPAHVRAMVLDGAVDPAESYDDSTIAQAVGFEHALDAFLEWCRTHGTCHFAQGGDPRRAYDSLAAAIEAEPERGTVNGETRILGPGEFDIGIASALYQGEDGYEALGETLAETARGDGSSMLRSADRYTDRETGGKYSNETAALYAISCLDARAPRTVAAVEQLAARAARVAPHFGASTTWLGLPCSFWPVPAPAAPRALPADGTGPILVLGNTNDPATPYAWAQALARELHDGHLLTYHGSGHTSYGRGSACVDDAVDDYLVKLTLPATTTC